LSLRIAAAVVAAVALVWAVAVGLPALSVSPGARTPPAVGCTIHAAAGATLPADAGRVVCLSGSSDEPLEITEGGTVDAPVIYSGGGTATVRGIRVEASNVIVQGFISADASAMGAKLEGNNIVFLDNTIVHPVYDGDDTDGIRFFGDRIKILHNTISNISDGSNCTNDGCGDGPHPDCLQTWYSDDHPTSSDIVIAGNRCEKAAAQCLMAEGPMLPDEGIEGPGQSANWVFDNNYCDDGANQALMIKNIKNLAITNNDFQGTNHKAIALADGSTGAHVKGNRLNPRIDKLVTFDDPDVADGYVGPTPDD
jgi:nitrous oxidase accessory protein NosD